MALEHDLRWLCSKCPCPVRRGRCRSPFASTSSEKVPAARVALGKVLSEPSVGNPQTRQTDVCSPHLPFSTSTCVSYSYRCSLWRRTSCASMGRPRNHGWSSRFGGPSLCSNRYAAFSSASDRAGRASDAPSPCRWVEHAAPALVRHDRGWSVPSLPVRSRWCSQPGTPSPVRDPEGPSPWSRAFAQSFGSGCSSLRLSPSLGGAPLRVGFFTSALALHRQASPERVLQLVNDSQAHPRALCPRTPHGGIEQERAPEDTPRPGPPTRGSIHFLGWLAPRRSDPGTLRRPPASMLDGKPDSDQFRRT